MLLNIIIGRSFFGNGPIMGVALNKHIDCVGATQWADTAGKGGRLATTRCIGGMDPDVLEARIRTEWAAWAERSGVSLTFTAGRRQVEKTF